MDTSHRVIRINLPIYIFISFYLFSTVRTYLRSRGVPNDVMLFLIVIALYIPLLLCCIKNARKVLWLNAGLFFIVLAYIINCLRIYPEYGIYYHETNGVAALVLTGFSSFFALLYFGLYYDESSIKDAMYYTAIINLIINILKLRYLFSQSASFLEYGYDMDYGYKVLFSCIVFLSVFLHTGKKIPIILSGVCLILLLLYGSRGPILCIITYVFLYYVLFRFKEYDKKKKTKIVLLFVSFCVIAYVYYTFISPMIDVSRLPRTVRAIVNVNYSDGTNESRKMIQGRVMDVINNNGFWGSGMLSDQAYVGVGRYSHNIFLEMQVTFGRIPGLIISALLIWRTIRHLREKRISDTTKNIYVIFLSLCVRLMVSYSFWYDPNFWCLIALGNTISYQLHKENKRKPVVSKGAVE